MKKIIALFVLHFLSAQLWAQEVPTMTVGGSKLDIHSMDVNVEVVGNVSSITYDMVFKNPMSSNTMAKVDFSIKDGQTLAGFATDVNGILTSAFSVEDKQNKVARGIVRKGDKPFIVTEIVKNKFIVQLEDVPASGKQRVVVRVYEELAMNKMAHSLLIPLSTTSQVDTFSSKVAVVSKGGIPMAKISNLGNLEFTKNKEIMLGKLTKKDVKLTGELLLNISLLEESQTAAFSDGHAYVYKTFNKPDREKPAPRTIDLYWDTSYSMKNRELDKELAFLNAYFQKYNNTSVTLIKFSNEIVSTESFKISGGNWNSLKEALENTIYDGGTSFNKLFEGSGSSEILMFSDGMKNMGRLQEKTNRDLFIIGSTVDTDHKGLRQLAAMSDGKYINLNALSIQEAMKFATTQSYKYLGFNTTRGVKGIDSYPNHNVQVGNDFSATFKNLTPADQITLHFGYGKEVVDYYQVLLSGNATDTNLAKGAFGIKQLNALNNSGESQIDAVVSTAKTYGLNSNETSFKVLRSAWDYVSYDVLPPFQYAAQYRSILNQNSGKVVVQNASTITGDVLEGNDAVRVITGQLTYENGEGIPGATVMIKNTSNGVATDEDGFYSIEAQTGDILVYSTMGYGDQEARIKLSPVMNIAFGYDEDADSDSSETTLGPVVITGQNIKKSEKSIGYAVDKIDKENFEQKSTGDVSRLLDGKSAGVQIVQTSGMSGSGTNVIVRNYSSIGGNNQALFIVDGVPFSNDTNATGGAFAALNGSSRAMDLDPNNIESVSVLKGLAATTLYGSLGRNGVVLITTKTGSSAPLGDERSNALVYSYDVNLKLLETKLKTSYIKTLSKITSVDEAYEVYLQQREKFSEYSAYFIDVFEFFRDKDEAIASRILSNVAEVDYEEHEQLRALAYKLEELSQYDNAIEVYEQIVRLRPADVQALRDLGLAYQETEQHEKAIIALEKANEILLSEEIDDDNLFTMFNREYNNVKRIAKAPEHEYVKTYNDLRIVVEWNNSNADLKLRVIDPKLEECSFENEKTILGGTLLESASLGSGPGEFTIKNAVKGDYYLHVDYSNKAIEIPTFVKVSVYKNFGSTEEKKNVKVIRLDRSYKNEMLTKVSF